MKCGLAGDVVALLQRAGGPVEALLAIGRGPLALNQGARLQATGPASVGGAGAPEGYAVLAAVGKRSLADLVAPAISMAEEGVQWRSEEPTSELQSHLRISYADLCMTTTTLQPQCA